MLDFQLAQNFAESFSLASGLGCILADGKGKLIHSAGMSCDRCDICAALGRGTDQCRQAQFYGMQEAERFGGKYIYFCTMGLTCFTSPIAGDDGAQGYITAGPFRMLEEQDDLLYVLNETGQQAVQNTPGLIDKIRQLPYTDPKRVNALSELLFMSAAFLSNASAAKQLLEKGESVHLQGQISDYLFQIKQNSAAQPYPYREEKRFLQAISRGDLEQTQELLNRLLGYILFETGGDQEQIQNRVHELLILLSRTLIEAGSDSTFVEKCIQQYRNEIRENANVEVLCLQLTKLVRSLIDTQFSNRAARHSDLIYRTMQFLHSDFSRKLSLEEVAHHVYISPTYLSRVFKAEVGCSMVDYLNRVRIEKSKELLANDNLRLIEVALQCGFESQSYFNRIFKQNCGLTPQQYRKKLLHDEQDSLSKWIDMKAFGKETSNE